jgi:Double zinc ribbon
MPLALFGLDGGWGLVVNLLILFLIVVYLALIYWTYLDARRRIEDPVLIACATAASVFPYLGTVVYTILRPPEFLEDREERELELRAAELELRQRIENSCPHCEYPIERTYLRCPNCERRLRNPCRKCHKPLDPRWGICPYCETEVRKQRPERSERDIRRTERARSAPPASVRPRADPTGPPGASSAPRSARARPSGRRAADWRLSFARPEERRPDELLSRATGRR